MEIVRRRASERHHQEVCPKDPKDTRASSFEGGISTNLSNLLRHFVLRGSSFFGQGKKALASLIVHLVRGSASLPCFSAAHDDLINEPEPIQVKQSTSATIMTLLRKAAALVLTSQLASSQHNAEAVMVGDEVCITGYIMDNCECIDVVAFFV